VSRVAVLEVGGTHAAAAWVEPGSWTVEPASGGRLSLPSDGSAEDLLAAFTHCLTALGPLRGCTLAVAMPGPFDYDTGVGRFSGVGKFDALNGVNVGAALRERLPDPPERIAFVNDAGAFGLGEWLVGGGAGRQRIVAVTLGTGVGSAFVDAGTLVSSWPLVPPEGHVYRLEIGGRPLEDTVSRRAMLARYRASASGSRNPDVDVRQIAELAASGDADALDAFVRPLRALGSALAPWLERFAAQAVVVGGAMSESWALVEPALRDGLRGTAVAEVPIVRTNDADVATAAGAAWHAVGGIEQPAQDVPAVDPGEAR
jgi:glucokinase